MSIALKLFWQQFSQGKTLNENEPPEQAMTHNDYWDATFGIGRREPTAEDSIRSIEAVEFLRRPPKAAGRKRNAPREGSERR